MLRAIRSRAASVGDTNRGVCFSLFGFPVRISHSFWLVVTITGLFGWTTVSALLEWVVVVLLAILLHELGHAAAASSWGIGVRINLHGAGGTTVWSKLWPLAWWKYMTISLAGPAAGFLIGAVLSLLPLAGSPLVRLAVRDLIWINMGW
jgi:stage IV sporulation protein FB